MVEAASTRPSAIAPTFDRSIVQQVIVSLVAIKIAGLILIVDPAGLLSFELPKSLFSRAMEWLIAGALLIAFLRYGVGIIPRTRLHLAVGALVVVSALSTLFAENRYIALFGEEDHYLGLTFVLDMAVLYLAVAVAFRRLADWTLFGGILAFATVLVLAYAAVQYLGLDPINWSQDPQSRTFSTLGHADTLGRYLSLIFGASLGVAALAHVSPAVRLAAAVLGLAVLAAAALAPIRGTLLAIASVLGVLPLLYLRMRGAARRDLAVGAVIAITAVALVGALLVFTPTGASAQRLIRDPSTQTRLLLLDSAFRASLDRPLLGYGPDNFAAAYPRYRQPDSLVFGFLADDAHNWLFQLAATTGVFGLVALVGAIVITFSLIWTRLGQRASALGPAFLLASVAYWVHASVTVATVGLDWFPYVTFGAVATMGKRPRASTPMMPRAASFVAVAFLAVGAAVGSVTGISSFLANRDAAIAASTVNSRPQVAMAAAEAAIRRDPDRADYWYWLGRAQEAQEAWPASAAAYSEAAARAPYERAYWADLARTLVHQAQSNGDARTSAAAIAAARRGTEVDPNEPMTHGALADTAYALGEYDLSLRAAVAAILLWPESGYDVPAVRAAARASDLRQARVLVEEALRLRDSAGLHLTLSQLALKLGDLSTARDEAKRTLELVPGDPEALRILSETGR
ncbi:MAG: O-antigen ligase family protein [Chloroflexota bacterium]